MGSVVGIGSTRVVKAHAERKNEGCDSHVKGAPHPRHWVLEKRGLD